MFDHPLSLAARGAVTLTALVFVIVLHRVLFRRAPKVGAIALGVPFAIAAAFSHIGPLQDMLVRLFPVGLVIAFAAAAGSLFSASARRAFDAVSDGEMRMMLAFRAMFGGLLIGLAAIGHFPYEFALAAGLGDMLVTWVAFAVPAPLDASGPRWARLVVHGVGLADMLMVVTGAITVVRPWSLAHGNSATTMTLPWLAVPLMFAINAHGLRTAIGRTETVGDGSESARGVRSAVS
jgi:hypothetical protein